MIPPGYTLLSTAYKKIAADTDHTEAWGVLRYLLVNGALAASSFSDDGHEITVSTEKWRSLPGNAWHAIFSEGSYDLDADHLAWTDDHDEFHERAARAEPLMIVVKKGELESVLQQYADLALERRATDYEHKNRGGRPPKYVGFACVVFRALYNAELDKYPVFVDFLAESMTKFSEKFEAAIEENIARQVAKPMYDAWCEIKMQSNNDALSKSATAPRNINRRK